MNYINYFYGLTLVRCVCVYVCVCVCVCVVRRKPEIEVGV